MLFVSRKKNKLGWQDTTWNFATTERKKQIVKYVKSLGIDFKNKKILCVAGGV